MSQDRQLMQIQKLVQGPKFGAHIVEKFTTEDELYSTDSQS